MEAVLIRHKFSANFVQMLQKSEQKNVVKQ
jgi:hypothetical protein